MRPVLLPLALALALGCAAVPLVSDVQGPGTVFASLDEAAVDALAYANGLAHGSRRAHLMHGGVLHAVPGGFSYGEVLAAESGAPNELTLVLRADAVAHFRTYPRSGSSDANARNERFSDADVENVDRVDPRRRPAYVLTPSLIVRVYRGEEQGVRRVARLNPPSWRLIAAHR